MMITTTTIFPYSRAATLLVATAALACTLAATTPARAQAANPGVFVPAPEGTVTIYQRKSEGSYGAYDGPVKWTTGQREWNGRTLIAVASERHGIALHDPKTHGVVVQMNSAGEPALSFNPEIKMDWPLAVGKTWSSTHEMTRYKPPGVSSLGMTFEVDAYEDVTVPAGTFKAYKIVQTSSFGEVDQTWAVPSLGLSVVKRISDRPASHPQGAGHLEGAMVSRTLPPR